MRLKRLLRSTPRTAFARALKETASKLWHYFGLTLARGAWNERIGIGEEVQARSHDSRGVDGAGTSRLNQQHNRIENDKCDERVDEREDPFAGVPRSQ